MIDCIEDTTHYRDRDGYANMRYQGKLHKAHRVTFYQANGYLPEVVRHTCDNPPCVNPLHLLPGTHADNKRDAVERGRHGRPPTLNHGMPDSQTDYAAYQREKYRRQEAGTWIYRTTKEDK